jgi:hypothetical protein
VSADTDLKTIVIEARMVFDDATQFIDAVAHAMDAVEDTRVAELLRTLRTSPETYGEISDSARWRREVWMETARRRLGLSPKPPKFVFGLFQAVFDARKRRNRERTRAYIEAMTEQRESRAAETWRLDSFAGEGIAPDQGEALPAAAPAFAAFSHSVREQFTRAESAVSLEDREQFLRSRQQIEDAAIRLLKEAGFNVG